MELKQYNDFDVFSRALIASRDVDPVYDFIKSTLKHFDFQPEWFATAYTTFYSLESAMIFCKEFPEAAEWRPKRFKEMREDGVINKMGHERRGTQRSIQNQTTMMSIFAEMFNGEAYGITNVLDFTNQRKFRSSLSRSVIMHGPWATYKVAEVFEKALGYTSLSINDLGIDEKDPNSNDGPVGGLRWLFGRDEQYDKNWVSTWNEFGEKLSKSWSVDIGEVESSLCKWHKIMTGNYWIGHDITEFVELKKSWGDKWESVMKENFDEVFWKDIEHFPKKDKTIYRDTGKLLNSQFSNQLPSADVLEIILKL